MASALGSITRALPSPPIQYAIIAGIITKATQIAICSFFRHSPRWVSLIARIDHFPGGQVLLNYGPSVLVALFTGIVLHKPSVYKPLHKQVDQDIKSETTQRRLPSIHVYEETHCKQYICLNFPKQNTPDPAIFCDAFGYAESNQTQIVGIAAGFDGEEKSQRTARALVDGFMEYIVPHLANKKSSLVKLAAQYAQKKIEESPQESDPKKHYGRAAFLGGLIETTFSNRRYFKGIHCGNCNLYRLRKGQFQDLTWNFKIDGQLGLNRTGSDPNEFTYEVEPGDQLFFMTAAVHDNLDIHPPEIENPNELMSQNDRNQRKLATLQDLSKVDHPGKEIMDFVLQHTKKRLTALEKGENIASSKDFPGKLGPMTLLVVEVP